MVAASGALVGLASAAPALAVETEPVDSAIDTVISAVKVGSAAHKHALWRCEARGTFRERPRVPFAAPPWCPPHAQATGDFVKSTLTTVEAGVQVLKDVSLLCSLLWQRARP